MADATGTIATSPGLSDLFAVGGALFLLLGVLFAGFYLLRRFGPSHFMGGRKGRQMSILGQLSMGPKRSLVMVRILNRVMVLGVTDHSINLIKELDHDTEHGTEFSQALDEANSGKGAD